MSGRKERLIVLGLFLVALGVRLVYVYQIRDNPFFSTPFGDPEYHDQWALQIARGNWLGEKVFFRAPLYPYLLGITYRIFGHKYLAPRILQAILGSLSCLLIYFIGKEVFSRRIAILSLGIASIYAPFIYFEGELLITSLVVFLNLLLILFLLKARNTWRWLAAGAVLGLSAIARPNILVFLPFILFWIWLHHRKHLLRYGFAVIGGAALLVAPVSFRNHWVGKDMVLIASQGGVNFYLGNNPHADGASAIFPGVGDDWDEVSFAERELGKSLKASEVSHHYYLKGTNWLKEEPGSFLTLLGKKIYLLFNGYEISNNQYIYQFREYSSLLKGLLFEVGDNRFFRFALPFGLISPLGLLGMWLSRGNPKTSLLRLFLLSYSLSIVLFFVCSRYRTPLYPILILFAAFALFSLRERMLSRESRLILPALVALFWFTNSNLYKEEYLNPAQHHFNLANVHLKRGEYQEAGQKYGSVLKLQPNYPRTHLNLGVTYHKRGFLDEAKAEYEKELEAHPEEARAYNNLGVISRTRGNCEEAINHGSRAIGLRPKYGEAYLNLGITHQSMGDTAKAVNLYRKAVEIDPSLAEGNSRLGLIHLVRQETEKARHDFEKAARLEPTNANHHYNLGLTYAQVQRYEEAIGEFEKSLELNPSLFQAHHNLGMTYLRLGDLQKSSHNLEEALRINPNCLESRNLLELIRGEGAGM